MTNDNIPLDPVESVFIILGFVTREAGGAESRVQIMLKAPDDDSAVRMALEALAAQDFAEAEFDQIGLLDGEPVEEPHATAFRDAMAGEICIVVETQDEERPRNPFEVLRGWGSEDN